MKKIKIKKKYGWILSVLGGSALALTFFIFYFFDLWDSLSFLALPFCEDTTSGICRIPPIALLRFLPGILSFLALNGLLLFSIFFFLDMSEIPEDKKDNKPNDRIKYDS